MSVIAKMYVQECGQFANGAQIRLSCVYDNDLSQPDNEDVRFTKASPSGNATMTTGQGLTEQSQWYMIFSKMTDDVNFDSARFALRVRCHVVHDYGTSKQVEISTSYSQEGVPESLLPINQKNPPFHMKITIDNPAASVQFEPNKEYWMQMHYAGSVTMTQAIQLARK
jgi:hypothetical protein